MTRTRYYVTETGEVTVACGITQQSTLSVDRMSYGLPATKTFNERGWNLFLTRNNRNSGFLTVWPSSIFKDNDLSVEAVWLGLSRWNSCTE